MTCAKDLAGVRDAFLRSRGCARLTVSLMILTRFVETMGGGVTARKKGDISQRGEEGGRRGMSRFRDSLSSSTRRTRLSDRAGQSTGQVKLSFHFVSSRLVMDRCSLSPSSPSSPRSPQFLPLTHFSALAREERSRCYTSSRRTRPRAPLPLRCSVNVYAYVRMCVRHELRVVRGLSRRLSLRVT